MAAHATARICCITVYCRYAPENVTSAASRLVNVRRHILDGMYSVVQSTDGAVSYVEDVKIVACSEDRIYRRGLCMLSRYCAARRHETSTEIANEIDRQISPATRLQMRSSEDDHGQSFIASVSRNAEGRSHHPVSLGSSPAV